MAVETVGPKTKTLVSMMMPASFAVGVAIDGLVAMSVRNWRTYQIVLGAPFLALMIFYFFLPESPRWLIATGRYKEAISEIFLPNLSPNVPNTMELKRSPHMKMVLVKATYI